ncbi:MAG: hypothetical protein JW837_04770 [Sedimentisphaerales bacterium]|nr:hypothetical protein [Sedimentisphaerales bacterium]
MSGKKSVIFFTFLSCLILFTSCDYKGYLKKQLIRFTPKKVDKLARDYIDLLIKADTEQAEELLDQRFVTEKTHSELQRCSEYLARDELISIEIVDFRLFKLFKEKVETRYNLTYQLRFKKSWSLLKFVIVEISGSKKIYRFEVVNIPESLEEINAFTFSDKSFRHYVILLFAIGIPVFIVYTIVLCVRTKMKRKWLWVVFIILGFGRLSFNWTGGQMGFIPFVIQLIPTSAFKGGPYAPWVINISVPLGALLFILKRRKMQKSESVEVSMVTDSKDSVTEEVDS